MRDRQCKKGSFSCFSDIGMSSNFWIRAWILISLSNGKSYGYELISGINDFFPEQSSQSSSAMGNYYRILRTLESQGLINSEWDTSGNGPAKRVYSITPQGLRELKSIFTYIEQTKEFVDKFINHFERREVK